MEPWRVIAALPPEPEPLPHAGGWVPWRLPGSCPPPRCPGSSRVLGRWPLLTVSKSSGSRSWPHTRSTRWHGAFHCCAAGAPWPWGRLAWVFWQQEGPVGPSAGPREPGKGPAPLLQPWGVGTFAGAGPGLLEAPPAGARQPPASGSPLGSCCRPQVLHSVTCSERPSGATLDPLLALELAMQTVFKEDSGKRGTRGGAETSPRSPGGPSTPAAEPWGCCRVWGCDLSGSFAKLWVRPLGPAESSQGKEGALGRQP